MTQPFELQTNREVRQGRPYPLGATLTERGVNFALFSKHARAVALLLFDSPHGDPTDVHPTAVSHAPHFWHAFVRGVRAGQLYGYKVDGRYDPANGYRFNPHKLLIDPYAKALTHKVKNTDGLLRGFERKMRSTST